MKKHPLYIICFLTILGIISASLLSIVNSITAPIIKVNALTGLKEELSKYDITLDKINENVSKVDKVLNIYEGNHKTNGKCYIFEIEEKQSLVKEPFSIFVVIDESDGTIVTFYSSDIYANEGYDDKFDGVDFGVIGTNKDNFENSFENVADATYTSNAFKDAFKVAFEQYEKM